MPKLLRETQNNDSGASERADSREPIYRELIKTEDSQRSLVDQCYVEGCTELAFGKFRPDNRVLCIEHGLEHSQKYRAIHFNATALIGVINRRPQFKPLPSEVILMQRDTCLRCGSGGAAIGFCQVCTGWMMLHTTDERIGHV
jgi:hypothetical protein